MSRRRSAGLSLLEVLAAVALLGILYAYLARAGAQGILVSGDSRMRLEAALVADYEMTQLETQLAAGVSLELGRSEREFGPFRTVVEVTPLPVPPELLPGALPGEGERDDAPTLLVGRTPDEPGMLQVVNLTVAWNDGVDDHEIERTTFAYDPTRAAELAAAFIPGGAVGGGATPADLEDAAAGSDGRDDGPGSSDGPSGSGDDRDVGPFDRRLEQFIRERE